MIVSLFDKNNELTDFYNLRCIKIYKKKEGIFKVINEISEISADTSSIKTLRGFLGRMIEEFEGCKIIVGSQITGIPFHFLVNEGFEICEAEFFSEELLQQIYEDYIEHPKNEQEVAKKELEKLEISQIPITPVAIDGDGNYFLDFVKIQKYRPEITSKKALLSFLSNEQFQTLTILCNHVMPWIENYVEQNNNIKYSTKRENGTCTIIITQK